MMDEPKILQGGNIVDDRGILSVCHTWFNSSHFSKIKRFYQVRNHKAGMIRAFHGHKNEAKYIYVVKGSIVVKVISMENAKGWDAKIGSGKAYKPHTYVLSEYNPQVLYIPPNYFNGWKSLTDDASVLFFSTSTLEESQNDDIRIPWDAFGMNIWAEDYR
jgi:dTDP-4-dehydrorhamnose 3,5-epimerase